jgi:hypothetical protein
MGQSISNSIKSAMAAQQEDMRQMQLATQERMRRMQMAQMMAMRRDMVMWMGGAWALAVSALVAGRAAGRAVPPIAALPLAAYTVVLAYNADAAYGNKMERVNKEFDKIVTSEKHWFTPIEPPAAAKPAAAKKSE